MIKKMRKEQGISQEDLCDGICSQSMLSRIEKGDYKASFQTIKQLAQRLGIDMNTM
ncbi:helix-turn-helix domain-containing protein [Salibacterium aidingense]|uniref:helix-turn-helix domain-containing protein n=1 Tax=Salibacterium aidingense TaxID=384933 RepID=UPI0003F5BD71|nr:helix-turn-helix transcriptional regulator [Salibacterium aidingense]